MTTTVVLSILMASANALPASVVTPIRAPTHLSLHLFSTNLLDEAQLSISSLKKDLTLNASLLNKKDFLLAESLLNAQSFDMERANTRLQRAVSRATAGSRTRRDIPEFFGLASSEKVYEVSSRLQLESKKAQVHHEELLNFESKVKDALKNLNFEVTKRQTNTINGLLKTTSRTVIFQRLTIKTKNPNTTNAGMKDDEYTNVSDFTC